MHRSVIIPRVERRLSGLSRDEIQNSAVPCRIEMRDPERRIVG